VHQIVAKLPATTAIDGALGGRLVHRGAAGRAAIALLLAAALGVGALALSIDLRARLIAHGDGHSALAKALILALRGL
jgi:hypothetical protein